MAAGGNPNNIVLGAGRLYVAAIGTAEPASASAALPSAWRAVGYTEDGTTVNIELTQDEIEVAEELDPVAYVMSKRKVSVSVQMAESTRRNLALSIDGSPNAVNTAASYEPSNPGAEVAFMMVWDSDEDPTVVADENIRWVFRSCKTAGSIELHRNKAPNKSLLPLEVMVQKPAGLAPFKVFPNASGLI